MVHESPILTGHLIYCLRSLSQRTEWNLGFTVPDALLTEQMTLGSSHSIASSLSHPSWKRDENSLPTHTKLPLSMDLYLYFYFLCYQMHARTVAHINTKQTQHCVSSHCFYNCFYMKLEQELLILSPTPCLFTLMKQKLQQTASCNVRYYFLFTLKC